MYKQIIIVANPRIYNWPEDLVVVEDQGLRRMRREDVKFVASQVAMTWGFACVLCYMYVYTQKRDQERSCRNCQIEYMVELSS